MARVRVLNPQRSSTREIAEAVNKVLKGRLNSTGEVTLTASATTTTIERPYITAESVVLLSPTTANAAAASPYITCAEGVATIHHANNAQTDRTFKFAILGG